MPRLKASSRRSPGPLVTTSGQVMRGAGSPGQQPWIGRAPRSMSAPVSTISWHGALPTLFGFIAMTVRSSGSSSSASRQPPGGSGCLRKASVSPTSRSCAGSRSMPQATRSTLPKRMTRTGIAYRPPSRRTTLSDSTARPPSPRGQCRGDGVGMVGDGAGVFHDETVVVVELGVGGEVERGVDAGIAQPLDHQHRLVMGNAVMALVELGDDGDGELEMAAANGACL